MAVAPAAESARRRQEESRTSAPSEGRVRVLDAEPCPCPARFPPTSHPLSHGAPHQTRAWHRAGVSPIPGPRLPAHLWPDPAGNAAQPLLSGHRQRVRTWVRMCGSPQPTTKPESLGLQLTGENERGEVMAERESGLYQRAPVSTNC